MLRPSICSLQLGPLVRRLPGKEVYEALTFPTDVAVKRKTSNARE
jgi:hypothetical protein